MLNWIFEGIVDWVSGIVTSLMDAVSGLFLNALGTDMTAMEEYFPFVGKAFSILQYLAWTLLFLITVWQLFRAFGGPITEAENPLTLIARSALFALLIGYAKPIFLFVLQLARAPYTALMDVTMSREDFTFAGIESMLKSGLKTLLANASVVGLILIIILMIALGWNYFKLLLEVVERYVLVGTLCYTSPLAYSMGASKATGQVFKSWCRMVGSQLLLLVLNVWFLRAFNSSVGRYIGGGAGLSNGQGSIFLWLFCAIAFLKIAQKFDSYLASIGLNIAQTGSGLGMELLVATRLIAGVGRGFRSAGGMMGGRTPSGGGGGFMSGFTDSFRGNSYVRDAVIKGGSHMGAGGPIGFVGRLFGGIAARHGEELNAHSISSVATKPPSSSGSIDGSIADRSIGNYFTALKGENLSGTKISGGHIETTHTSPDGKETALNFYNADQYERPNGASSVITAADGSRWYQTASGAGADAFFTTPHYMGEAGEADAIEAMFPEVGDVTLRTVSDGVLEASSPSGNTLWYSGNHFAEPSEPHSTIQASDGSHWYAVEQSGAVPAFEKADGADGYNAALFKSYIPGYEGRVSSVNPDLRPEEGRIEIKHEDGSGTMFYDSSLYAAPHGTSFQTYEDANGHSWYATDGKASVERVPVYEHGKAVYDGEHLKTKSVESIRYQGAPSQYEAPQKLDYSAAKQPVKKLRGSL